MHQGDKLFLVWGFHFELLLFLYHAFLKDVREVTGGLHIYACICCLIVFSKASHCQSVGK